MLTAEPGINVEGRLGGVGGDYATNYKGDTTGFVFPSLWAYRFSPLKYFYTVVTTRCHSENPIPQSTSAPPSTYASAAFWQATILGSSSGITHLNSVLFPHLPRGVLQNTLSRPFYAPSLLSVSGHCREWGSPKTRGFPPPLGTRAPGPIGLASAARSLMRRQRARRGPARARSAWSRRQAPRR